MTRNPADLLLNEHLDYLKLTSVKENCQPLAVESAANHWSHLDYLGRLLQGEVAARQQHDCPADQSRPFFRSSRPWKASVGTGPKNERCLGLVGLGKTDLATALGYAACQHRYSVL